MRHGGTQPYHRVRRRPLDGARANCAAACSPVSSRMEKNRLEAFSDGVLAIIITIMVLELKVPPGSDLAALKPVVPVFLTYLLSFIYAVSYTHLTLPTNREV